MLVQSLRASNGRCSNGYPSLLQLISFLAVNEGEEGYTRVAEVGIPTPSTRNVAWYTAETRYPAYPLEVAHPCRQAYPREWTNCNGAFDSVISPPFHDVSTDIEKLYFDLRA
ncbi:uncharacterized protein MYCFIDRAFT_175948 [Pseudocercospora fijiensis CIRAD86]|uniref:Uncharacterized protein n=1 Tax=Pseudocercospora fijiensis (strain CIRAD86) TaxID=383855 RepID=M3ACX9_PSEFD|nr:uncharacterized protein MYCFIDRAFT_175948 [Pseudocercospora fijiensis CIRAD86]EME82406.1 hypothetical protein MYCFIDRAFT_175948 [Pseudocercospora fijiensis CIRAD86]